MTQTQYLKISIFCRIWKRQFGYVFSVWKTDGGNTFFFSYKSNYFQFLPLHSSTAIMGERKCREKKSVKKIFKRTVQGQSES